MNLLISIFLGFVLFVPTAHAGDPADWSSDAVIYGIAPWYISKKNGVRFRVIEQKIPELKDLGVNTLWLQPVYANHGKGQAYDITDYFKVWDELGTEADLRHLIRTAHASGMRVIFDFVANHVSVEHPFAKDAAAKGTGSPYYEFFAHEGDRAPYSEHYHRRRVGHADFLYYFWPDLVNLDYTKPATVDHVTRAALHWVRDFDIDGYRFDAAWAIASRAPGYWPSLFSQLRRAKRNLFFLGEDKAPRPEAYKGTTLKAASELFDGVYDWTGSRDHISEWSWQQGSEAKETVFNSVPENERAEAVRHAV